MAALMGRRGLADAAKGASKGLLINIELLTSEVVCCAGKRHLRSAMEKVTKEPMTPGQDPKFEETNRVRLIRKWGGEAGWEVQKQRHRLKERGQEVGIEHFNLDRVASNTMASHRVVQWITKTKGPDAAERLYDLLNQRHFVEGRKLNDPEMLADAACEAAAVNKTDTIQFIHSNEGLENIQAALRILGVLGVHSIPTFIVDGRFRVDGAARSDEFVALFRKIERDGRVDGKTVFGEALAVPQEVAQQGLNMSA